MEYRNCYYESTDSSHPKWNLNYSRSHIPIGPKTKHYNELIKYSKVSEQREKELVIIDPKLDNLFIELKTKKNIIEFIKRKGVKYESWIKREKKDEMIRLIKIHLRNCFRYHNDGNKDQDIITLLYSL